MEFDSHARIYELNDSDKTLPELVGRDFISEEEAFTVMNRCATEIDKLGNQLLNLSAIVPLGPRLNIASRDHQIRTEISIRQAVIKCIGDQISLDSTIKEIQDFANRANQ